MEFSELTVGYKPGVRPEAVLARMMVSKFGEAVTAAPAADEPRTAMLVRIMENSPAATALFAELMDIKAPELQQGASNG